MLRWVVGHVRLVDGLKNREKIIGGLNAAVGCRTQTKIGPMLRLNVGRKKTGWRADEMRKD